MAAVSRPGGSAAPAPPYREMRVNETPAPPGT